MGMTNAHRASLLARAKRANRVMRAHPYLALLIEGFMLFALVSFLRTPSAWADVYEVESGGDQQSGIAVENVKQETFNGPDYKQTKRWVSDYPELQGKTYTTRAEALEAEKEIDRQKPKGDKSNQPADNGNKPEGNGNKPAGNENKAGNQPANGTSNKQSNTAAPDTEALNVSSFMQRLDGIVTHFLMPVAVAWASWQLVYVALVCGLMGIDPLHVVNKNGDLTNVDVWQEVRNRFKNFAYGLAWIAGVWLIFEASVFLVSNLVGILEARL